MSDDEYKPVRVLAGGRDATLTCEILHAAGIDCQVGRFSEEAFQSLEEIHLLIVAEELLGSRLTEILLERLAAQPAWSDLPIVVISRRGGPTGRAMGAVTDLGNVSVLERPLKIDELITVVRSSLRARRRQFQVRDLLREGEEADRRKDEFLAMLAHELRNPLAPIRSVAGLMRMLDVTDPDLIEGREILERQVKHMARLIDDLLDVSRITRGAIELKSRRINLVDLVANSARTAAPAIEATGRRLVLQLPHQPIAVDGDPTRFEQIVSNLLSNASKYTDPGGEIHLGVEHAPPHAVVRVSDDGIGIDPAILPRIFDLFAQADRSLDRTRGGLGVGLTIVKRLVELHGGSIEVRSDGLGKGTQVVVRLPAVDAATGGAVGLDGPNLLDRHPSIPDCQPLRVLIVEDNRDAANLLARALRRYGHDLRVAYDGISGLVAAREFLPQVVISDIGLPGLDGHQLAQALSKDPTLPGLFLVAVTGYGGEETIDLSRQSGFHHHLVKPIDVGTLVPLLRKLAASALVPSH